MAMTTGETSSLGTLGGMGAAGTLGLMGVLGALGPVGWALALGLGGLGGGALGGLFGEDEGADSMKEMKKMQKEIEEKQQAQLAAQKEQVEADYRKQARGTRRDTKRLEGEIEQHGINYGLMGTTVPNIQKAGLWQQSRQDQRRLQAQKDRSIQSLEAGVPQNPMDSMIMQQKLNIANQPSKLENMTGTLTSALPLLALMPGGGAGAAAAGAASGAAGASVADPLAAINQAMASGAPINPAMGGMDPLMAGMPATQEILSRMPVATNATTAGADPAIGGMGTIQKGVTAPVSNQPATQFTPPNTGAAGPWGAPSNAQMLDYWQTTQGYNPWMLQLQPSSYAANLLI